MSTRWLPKWKVVKINVKGKEVEVCYDDDLKLYACPFCNPICKKGGIPDYSTYFYHVEDLVSHIIAHKNALWLKKRPQEIREEEEEGEEEDNEED
ncbi:MULTISPECIES: hypothetical protein [Acidianus]|jgi:hypothetical protein|uniref:Uncharacterized protein n=2 Tax=Acidianus TaxID=12914 RepID=A0A650CXV8_ACIAM|nr:MULTISPECIES: hypothetical protein [Acidianus]AEE93765.1 conserved hypothetical protein [Acidianus hospitalis W1]MDT7900451.1 hypothetical protein [Acidianus sp.]MQL54876.1 hypothetical protein [Acidianus ambivalens]QGR22663.1 hypothetical protein D1866_12290 [Acidianus ambivalens]